MEEVTTNRIFSVKFEQNFKKVRRIMTLMVIKIEDVVTKAMLSQTSKIVVKFTTFHNCKNLSL